MLLLAATGILLVLFFFDPARFSFYPRCPLHSVTGLDCPTCGSLRAIHQLLHGHVRAAYALNPLLFYLVPAGLLLVFRPIRNHCRWLLWPALALLVGYFIWRNWFTTP